MANGSTFQIHNVPIATHFSRRILFGMLGAAGLVIFAAYYAWSTPKTPQQEYRPPFRSETEKLDLKTPEKPLPHVDAPPPPPPPPPPHVDAPPPPPPPPPAPRQPKPPDPRIAMRREAYLKALKAPVIVEGLGVGAPQYVTGNTNGAQQPPNGQMPLPWQQGLPQGAMPGQMQGWNGGQFANNQPSASGMGGAQPGQYLSSTVQRPRSAYQLNAGSIIPVTLMRPITTDAPGQTVAIVALPVFDSVSGRFMLIPQGSQVVGRYDTEVGPQARLNIAFDRLYFPKTGCYLSLQGTLSIDAQGFAGVTGDVNRHFFQRYGAVAGLSLITAAISLAGNNSGSSHYYNYSPGREAARGASEVLGRAIERDLDRAMDIPPTVTVQGGLPFNVDVVQDIVFTKPYNPEENCQ